MGGSWRRGAQRPSMISVSRRRFAIGQFPPPSGTPRPPIGDRIRCSRATSSSSVVFGRQDAASDPSEVVSPAICVTVASTFSPARGAYMPGVIPTVETRSSRRGGDHRTRSSSSSRCRGFHFKSQRRLDDRVGALPGLRLDARVRPAARENSLLQPGGAMRDDRYVSDRDAETIREAVGLVAFLVRLAFGIVKLVLWCWVGVAVLMLAMFLLSALTS